MTKYDYKKTIQYIIVRTNKKINLKSVFTSKIFGLKVFTINKKRVKMTKLYVGIDVAKDKFVVLK